MKEEKEGKKANNEEVLKQEAKDLEVSEGSIVDYLKSNYNNHVHLRPWQIDYFSVSNKTQNKKEKK